MRKAYKYSGLPLSPSIAAELVVEFLSEHTAPVRRVDITRFVESRHKERGGVSVPNSQNRVVVALRRLVDDQQVTNPAYGYYLLRSEPKADIESSAASNNPPDPTPSDIGELLVPEEVIGEGDESVYVYFVASERRLAKLENKASWPCKVGYTSGSLTTRIISQGITTSMARLPCLGLVIRSDDGRGLERALHLALDMSGSRIVDSLGSEWFETSPQKVSAWYSHYKLAINQLRQ